MACRKTPANPKKEKTSGLLSARTGIVGLDRVL